jgi:integrase
MLAQRGNPTSGLLFLTERGRPLYPAWSFRLLKRLGRIASVPQAEQLSAHSLRATAITELLNAGVTLRDAQDFAGTVTRGPRAGTTSSAATSTAPALTSWRPGTGSAMTADPYDLTADQ